jgi:hypothetical protein
MRADRPELVSSARSGSPGRTCVSRRFRNRFASGSGHSDDLLACGHPAEAHLQRAPELVRTRGGGFGELPVNARIQRAWAAGAPRCRAPGGIAFPQRPPAGWRARRRFAMDCRLAPPSQRDPPPRHLQSPGRSGSSALFCAHDATAVRNRDHGEAIPPTRAGHGRNTFVWSSLIGL